MHSLFKCLVILLFAMSFLSCTSLSKEECQTMNWFERGNSDGANGRSADQFARYKSSCAEHSVSIDQKEYMRGRTIGLQRYCTHENGYEVGKDNESYDGVCPSNLEAQFLKGYQLGKREYQLQMQEQALERQKKELEKEQAILNAKQSLLSRGSKTCSFDSDCARTVSCSFGKCDSTGASCNWNSDCTIKGRCSEQSTWVDGTLVQVSVCDY